ncbi:hypothetical protein BJ508DRAFT_46391 [Ascobolus immersus RN42]|uniref:BTB domain-containing protein n=1 Tax=Ascobolus immersus RN42 TaxID=1160509 RepID=A0A3N4ICY4_ASCIM|nr:hypothetical protein BJ508DRAFT_46391 [Ascobolus immersus RN42]
MSDDVAPDQAAQGLQNLSLDESTQPESSKRHVLAEEGDLEIVADDHTFLVSSKVLSAASPVFKSILAKKDYSEEPFNTHASAAATSIILSAYLGKVQEPQTLTELAEVASFIEMYGLQEELKQHITGWADAWAIDDMDGLDLETLASWVCISWAFGLEDIFEMATREVIRFCKYNSEEERMYYREPPIDVIAEDVIGK